MRKIIFLFLLFFVFVSYSQNQLSTCETNIMVDYDTTNKHIVSGYWIYPDMLFYLTNLSNSPVNNLILLDIIQPHNFYVDGYKQFIFYYYYIDIYNLYYVDSISITFYQKPICYPKIDTVICGKIFDVDMYEWSGTSFLGEWTALPGNPGNCIFLNQNEPKTIINVTNYGTYYFIWTEYNSLSPSCYCKDTLVVNFISVPSPHIETDFMNVCNSKFACFCVNATGPGYWSGPTGISFYDAPDGNFNPSYKDSTCTCIKYPYTNDTIVMYWTEFNGYSYGYDSLLIAFLKTPHPEILTISPQNICNTSLELEAENIDWGSGYWISNYNTLFQPDSSQIQTIAHFDTSQTNSFILIKYERY